MRDLPNIAGMPKRGDSLFTGEFKSFKVETLGLMSPMFETILKTPLENIQGGAEKVEAPAEYIRGTE